MEASYQVWKRDALAIFILEVRHALVGDDEGHGGGDHAAELEVQGVRVWMHFSSSGLLTWKRKASPVFHSSTGYFTASFSLPSTSSTCTLTSPSPPPSSSSSSSLYPSSSRGASLLLLEWPLPWIGHDQASAADQGFSPPDLIERGCAGHPEPPLPLLQPPHGVPHPPHQLQPPGRARTALHPLTSLAR